MDPIFLARILAASMVAVVLAQCTGNSGRDSGQALLDAPGIAAGHQGLVMQHGDSHFAQGAR